MDNQNNPARTDASRTAAADGLAAFRKLLWSNRMTIVRVTISVTVLVTAYAFVMPHTYSSTVTILPPRKDDRNMGIADMLASGGAADMLDLGATLGFGGKSSDIFVKILSSRTVSDSLIRLYDLNRFFGISDDRPWRLAARPLKEATVIDATKDGMVAVTVSLKTSHLPSQREIDSIKQRAADIANAYVRYLDFVNREKLVSAAKNSRLFIQEQIERTSADLAAAYSELVAYQERNKALMVDKQLDALVTTAGTLKLWLAQAEGDLAAARRDMTPASRTVQDLESAVRELQKQYDQLAKGDGRDEDFVLAFARLPQVARDLATLLRRVKRLEEVNAYLNKQ